MNLTALSLRVFHGLVDCFKTTENTPSTNALLIRKYDKNKDASQNKDIF